jgi:16S rRNA (uracil1498-N3)-methyltransferase
MRRFWIAPDKLKQEEVRFEGDLFHHLRDVCRIEVGNRFELLCGDGWAYFTELTQLEKRSATGRILEKRELQKIRKPFIHLCVSVPRFQKMDLILEKAVELGVYEVHPFVSDHSFVRSVNEALTGKQNRWLKIIQSATEQSGRGDLMRLSEPVQLKELFELFNRQPNAAGLFPYEGPSDSDIKSALTEVSAKVTDSIWLFVGSEGGFSLEEVAFFRSHQLKPVTLGSQVLRVETACLALVSVIKYHYDLMK